MTKIKGRIRLRFKQEINIHGYPTDRMYEIWTLTLGVPSFERDCMSKLQTRWLALPIRFHCGEFRTDQIEKIYTLHYQVTTLYMKRELNSI